MRTFVSILALVAIAAADVSHIVNHADKDASIVQQSVEVEPDKYSFGFETSNGISAQESGALKNVGREDEAISVQGSNRYTGPDGVAYALTYVADENGYRAEGPHLPTPPPAPLIPDYIQRSLEYIATHPSKPEPGSKY